MSPKPPISLRKHLLWLIAIKMVVIMLLKVTFFPSVEESHQPADIYFNDQPNPKAVKESS